MFFNLTLEVIKPRRCTLIFTTDSGKQKQTDTCLYVGTTFNFQG